MYDTFMLITGIIFMVLSLAAAFLFATLFLVNKAALNSYFELRTTIAFYEDAIERANETVVEKFRHDLDHHSGENLK